MDEWTLSYDHWNPQDQKARESLCTLGNGYWFSRGAAEEARQETGHDPGTYLAGVYNRRDATILGECVSHETVVNWPNWLYLTYSLDNGSWFTIDQVRVREYRQDLNMQHGLLTRRLHVQEPGGRETLIDTVRLVHMQHPHLAALRWTLTPLNWSGRLRVRSGVDTGMINRNVDRYRQMNGKHFEVRASGLHARNWLYVVSESLQSRIQVAQGLRTVPHGAGVTGRHTLQDDALICEEFLCEVQDQVPWRMDKVTALYHSRDRAISDPLEAVNLALESAPSFEELLRSHQDAWQRLWTLGDIRIQSTPEDQLMLRLHIFHLLQTTSPHLADLDAGLPARGLTGEMYQGHIFWDQLFALPYINMRLPATARAMLLYRSRRRLEARHQAQQYGCEGWRFPWRSASDGSDQTARFQWNPLSGHWTPDHTHLQCHQNAAIVYEIWKYYQATADLDFLQSHGGELILQIARFLAGMSTFQPDTGRYHIRGVVGPDEFHTGYPDSEAPGLDDNAYTNVMTVWTLRCARGFLNILPDYSRHRLLESLSLNHTILEEWEEIARRMYVPFHGNGIISQFTGYERLQELDWDAYRKRYGDIRRMDRILEAEGDSVNRYKISKQPDALMLCYLLTLNELEDIFKQLDYPFSQRMLAENIAYYRQRTTHGSTLSRVVLGWIHARSDRKGSWEYLTEALGKDAHEIQGGSTGEGVHIGAMAGTIDLIQRCYGGVDFDRNMLTINPRLPDSLHGIAMTVLYRYHLVTIRIAPRRLDLQVSSGPNFPLVIQVRGQKHMFGSPGQWECAL